VDLGAGSGRVFLGAAAPDELVLEEVRRFEYAPRPSGGHLRWTLAEILGQIKAGAREAGARARAKGRPVRSLGVDGWGVDYGLIDAGGKLIEDPVSYRDERTRGEIDRVGGHMSCSEIFARTGIQFLDFNTLFQLTAHVRSGLPGAASRLLLIPDLIHFFLCGRAATEYTNATTTQLVNAGSRTWDRQILGRLGLPSHLLTEIVPAGSDLGPLAPPIADDLGLPGARVIAPATHDTGSAVAGAPLEDGWAYISSGTWSLVGVERASALLGDSAARHNFSNEGGAFGTFRFLKNVMGLWILESCRREWRTDGRDVGYEDLLRGLRVTEASPRLIFPDDPRFFNPPSMLAAIAAQLAETGQTAAEDPPAVAKLVLDSLAFRYASVLRTLESVTATEVRGLRILGGGSRNEYLNQVTATVSGRPVRAGPVEATVTGNLIVQAIAQGGFNSLREARRRVAESLPRVELTPQPSRAWEDAGRRYQAIEARYL
jgi:rhamnulokinase